QAELAEDLAQVIVDRARAQVELFRDLPVGHPRRDQTGDLELLRRQLVKCRRVALPCLLARGAQLAFSALLPRRRSDLAEEVGCPPQMLPRLTPVAVAPQPFTVEQLGAGHMERRDGRVWGERRLEVLSHVAVTEKRPAAGEYRPPRGGGRVLRPLPIAVEAL